MQLILVRHGLPQRVELERGRADPPLADVGRHQARLVAAVLAAERIDAIYSSPLRRATETAAPLAQALGMQPAVREGLAEFDRGAARASTGERNLLSLNETQHTAPRRPTAQ